MQTLEQKKHRLFLVLSGIFLTNAILAEMIGVKIFSAESTVGLTPGSFHLFGHPFVFTLTAGVVIWPVVFITSDLINEYFGQPGVRRISYLTAGLIAYAFLVIFLSMKLAPSDFWLKANGTDPDGKSFNIDYAFNTIFGQGLRIIFASLCAFLFGQLVDVFIFHRMKLLTGNKKLWLRATGSTIVSQLVDSFVVLYIAFYGGKYTTEQLNSIGITNYVYKFVVAILLTPVIYLGHHAIDRYMGAENAKQMSEEAAKESNSFF